MACSLTLVPPGPASLAGGGRSTAGPFHYRSSNSEFKLFRDHSPRRRARRGGGRGDRERDPGIPAGGAVLRSEFAVVLQIEIALQVADRKDESELRPDADHLRLKAADPVAGAAVAADLLVDVADRADLKLLV